jgi:hypothetical protein
MKMPEWLRVLISVATSEEVMRAVVIVGVGYLGQVSQRNNKDRQLAEITIDLVDFIEEHYSEWGIRGPAKLERFLQLFSEEFHRVIGRQPTPRELQTAKLKAEAHVQRARRGDFRSSLTEAAVAANGVKLSGVQLSSVKPNGIKPSAAKPSAAMPSAVK